jgi:hypothetical protein
MTAFQKVRSLMAGLQPDDVSVIGASKLGTQAQDASVRLRAMRDERLNTGNIGNVLNLLHYLLVYDRVGIFRCFRKSGRTICSVGEPSVHLIAPASGFGADAALRH